MSDTPIYNKLTKDEEPKTSLTPVPKVAAAGIAGAITIVLVWAANLIWPEVEIPEPVVVAVTAIITVGTGYLKKG